MKKVLIILILIFSIFSISACSNEQTILSENILNIRIYKRYQEELKLFIPLVTSKKIESFELLKLNGENSEFFSYSYSILGEEEYNGYSCCLIFINYAVASFTNNENILISIDSANILINDKEYTYDFGNITILEEFASFNSIDFLYKSQDIASPSFISTSIQFNNLYDIEIIDITNTLGIEFTNKNEYIDEYSKDSLIDINLESNGFDDAICYNFDLIITYKLAGSEEIKYLYGVAKFASMSDLVCRNFVDRINDEK